MRSGQTLFIAQLWRAVHHSFVYMCRFASTTSVWVSVDFEIYINSVNLLNAIAFRLDKRPGESHLAFFRPTPLGSRQVQHVRLHVAEMSELVN